MKRFVALILISLVCLSGCASSKENDIKASTSAACTSIGKGSTFNTETANAFGELARKEPKFLPVTKAAIRIALWTQKVRDGKTYGPIPNNIEEDLAVVQTFCHGVN